MINLIKSNRMECLLEELAQVMADPIKDSMAPEWIAVQSRGMKQWLSLGIAQRTGICSNIFFAYPRQMIQKILDANQVSSSVYLDPGKMLWSAMGFLEQGLVQKKADYKRIFDYLKNDVNHKKHIQLSFRIAQLLDNYQVWRPDLLMAWEKGEFTYAGENKKQEIWQAACWKHMAQNHRHSSKVLESFIQEAEKTENCRASLPAHRICLFGISSLPPSFLAFFNALARQIPVHLFLLSPSNQFFMDLISQRRLNKMRLDSQKQKNSSQEYSFFNQKYYETGHPLLTSLGGVAQEFHSALEDCGYAEISTKPSEDLFLDPAENKENLEQNVNILPVSMLHRIQSDILGAIKPENKKYPIFPKDKSISIHSCHSPFREAQTVKDLLLEAFKEDPDLCPHEVIVMMPDIESYAPVITSVFSPSADKNEPYIPFCISDRKRRVESSTLEAFLHILDMKNTRLERDQVLNLLTCDSIAQKFHISSQEIELIKEAITETRIFWGRDKEHRKELTGSQVKENTWIFGLDRLFMGYAMDQEALTNSVLAKPFFEGTQSEVLGRFSHFCHCLFDAIKLLEGSHNVKTWAQNLRQVVISLMDQNPSTQEEINLIFSTIETIVQDAGNSGYEKELSFEPVFEILKHFLDEPLSQGYFSTGVLTFCNLLPMRSIPFKVIVLMGMDEKSFPRQVLPCSFDLMAQFPRRGDKNQRNEDRYLFLETILSARNRLIITYTGKSIRDNSLLPCSGVVSELMDVIDQGFDFPENFGYQFSHFLHGFHLEYFTGQPSFFSFSPGRYRIAQAQITRGSRKTGKTFLNRQTKDKHPDSGFSPEKPVGLQEMIYFFSHPARYYMEKGMNIQIARHQEPEPDTGPFQLKGLDRYSITEQYMKIRLSGVTEDLEPFFRAAGYLPPDRQGKLQLGKIQDQIQPLVTLAKKMVPSNPVHRPMQICLHITPWILTGTIDHLYQPDNTLTRWIVTSGRLTPKRLLSHWIHHLVLSTHMGASKNKEASVITKMLGQNTNPGKSPVIYEFTGVEQNPEELLRPLLEIFYQGQQSMVPFFPVSCFALVCALAEKNFSHNEASLNFSLEKAKKEWFQPYTGGGESTDPYIARILKDKDPFASVELLKSSGVLDTAIRIYQPLLTHLSQV